MKIKICECPKSTCRYRWIPRVRDRDPKECPNCKHRFIATWGLPLKCEVVGVGSMAELKKLRADIAEWNERGRWKA
jgi:hypothetical protein